jgi:hypothetical protein
MGKITEDPESRSLVINGEGSTYTQVFSAAGYENAGLVGLAIRQQLPRYVIVDGYILNSPRNISIKPVVNQSTIGGTKGDNWYRVTVTYSYTSQDAADGDTPLEEEERTPEKLKERDENESGNLSFSISTGSELKVYAIDDIPGQSQLVTDFAGDPVPPPYGGFATNKEIGMDEFGKVSGVDVAKPSCSITITKTFSDAYVTEAKRKEWMGYVGMVNKKEWAGLPVRCVMLTGINGSQRANSDLTNSWPMTFSFEYKAPSDFEIQASPADKGDHGAVFIADIAGYDYTWVQSKKKVANKIQMNVPVKVYTQQVYEELDFAVLDLNP